MTRPATTRLKCNPPLGRMPVLQFAMPGELQIDAAYQRSIQASDSQALIRRIAQHWNWDLCQPLVVSRREDGSLYVIDGQHRLEAAKLRGDIAQLPCVIGNYASAADEAASFVHLNQQRRPLGKLDVFKAAVASGDPEACAIVAALTEAGLSVAPHSNYTAWKPGMVANVGGIEAAWRRHGPEATSLALTVMECGLSGQVLRYAGTIFPGIVAVCVAECQRGRDPVRIGHLVAMVGSKEQTDWRRVIMRARSDDANLKFAAASAKVFLEEWGQRQGSLGPTMPERAAPAADSPAKVAPVDPSVFKRGAADEPIDPAKAWCAQCDRRVTQDKVAKCLSPFCAMKKRA